MLTGLLAIWFLGGYMAARYMLHTHGPSPVFTPIYILILALWPVWVAVWLVCDAYEAARRPVR